MIEELLLLTGLSDAFERFDVGVDSGNSTNCDRQFALLMMADSVSAQRWFELFDLVSNAIEQLFELWTFDLPPRR